MPQRENAYSLDDAEAFISHADKEFRAAFQALMYQENGYRHVCGVINRMDGWCMEIERIKNPSRYRYRDPVPGEAKVEEDVALLVGVKVVP